MNTTIAMIGGNVGPTAVWFATENAYLDAFTALGCTVVPILQGALRDLSPADAVTHIMEACGGAVPDLVTYTRTHNDTALGKEHTETWRILESLGAKTASIHLDVFWGLPERISWIQNGDPMFTTGTVFTADGGSERHWAELNINHVWLPPGFDERGVPAPNRLSALPDLEGKIVFVGSEGYHKSWSHRPEMVAHLNKTYGARFVQYGGGSPFGTVRGDDLNRVYASDCIVVGDFCFAGQRANYWCVDEDTEVLTSRGWLRYDDVHEGDIAYTMDPESGLGEWQSVQAVTVFPAERREMWAMEGERHSSLTTLDHRWLVESTFTERDPIPFDVCPECGWTSDAGSEHGRRWGVSLHLAKAHGMTVDRHERSARRRRFRLSHDLKQPDRIPLAAPCTNLPTEAKYEDAFVELVAWAWTEGSAFAKAATYRGISQSHRVNEPYCARIRACLETLCGPPVEGSLQQRHVTGPAWGIRQDQERGMTIFKMNRALGDRLWQVAPDHVVDAAFINALTVAQLRLFIETSIDADGCRKSSHSRGLGPYSSVTIAQAEGRRLDAFEMACALIGLPTNRTLQGGANQNNIWLTHVKRRLFTAPLRRNQSVKAEVVEHDGIVWCPTTSNSTWLARRRGTVYFTGNSDRVPESLGRGAFLLVTYTPGIEEWYTRGVDLDYWTVRDFNSLDEKIAQWTPDNMQRRLVAQNGRELATRRDTYKHRARTVLEHLGIACVE